MKTITVLFFGKLKDTWNTNKLTHQTSCKTIEELYLELLEKITEIPHKASIKVAINDEFANWQSHIESKDTIAFLPPASGG